MSITYIKLPDKYHLRLVARGDGNIRVFGDPGHKVTLGVVDTQAKAIALLDGFDNSLERRKKIAELVDRDHENNERK